MSEMSSNPLVSVIVPVYNAAKYLHQTLGCICGQTLKNIEIILVDDGSTDESMSILKEYQEKDSRIIVIQQQNQYAGAARNNGMKVARGRYLSFLDADDVFELTMLEKMAQRAESVQADVVICKADTFDSKEYTPEKAKPHNRQNRFHLLGNLDKMKFCPRREAPSQLYQFTFGFAWDKLYRASTVRKYGYKFDEIPQCNDAGFSHSMVACAEVCSIVDECLAHYRIDNDSVSHKTDREVTSPVAVMTMKKNLLALESNREAFDSFKRMAIIYLGGQLCNANNRYRESYIQRLREEIEPEMLFLKESAEFYDEQWAYQIYRSMVEPEISVVVPIYNAQDFLLECLQSLKAQTYPYIEIICVNDGSKDDSLRILRDFAKTKDHRIKIIDVPNGGYGKAMNLGLRAAKGKYFAILEPDDYLPPNAYESLIGLAKEHKLDLVRGKFCRFHSDAQGKRVFKEEADYKWVDKVIRPRDYHELFYNMSLATWTCLYDMDFLKKQGIDYHESPGASYQDTGFFMQAFGYAERAMFTNETVYMYRTDNAASSTNTKSGKPYAMQNEFAFIKDRYFSRPERWENLQELYLMRRMAAHRWIYKSIPESLVADYLKSFRKELIELSGVSRERFVPVDTHHYDQISISPVHFLRNAGKFPGSEKIIQQFFSPLHGAKYTQYPAHYESATPAVSVIVPVYSGIENFAFLIALLRSQTLRNMEFIFVDDCGEDGSFALAELAAQDDPRIKLLRNEKNCGPGLSRNKGIAAASGEYIAFVDADDIISVDFYEKLYTTAVKTKAKVVKCSRANKFDDGRIEPSGMNQMIREKLAAGEHIINAFGWEHTTAIYNREHVLSNGSRNSDARQDEDTTFIMMTLYNLKNDDLVVIDEPCYLYRMHEASVTHKIDSSYLFEAAKSLEDKLNFILLQPSTPYLEKYAACQIEGRLTWRYTRTLDSDSITEGERKAYVEKVCKLIYAYQQKRPQHAMYGFSKKLASGEMTTDSYITFQQNIRMKTTSIPDTTATASAIPTNVLDELERVQNEIKLVKTHIAFLCDLDKYRRRYRYHRVMSWLTLGKTRKKHKEREARLKLLTRNYKTLIQKFTIM